MTKAFKILTKCFDSNLLDETEFKPSYNMILVEKDFRFFSEGKSLFSKQMWKKILSFCFFYTESFSKCSCVLWLTTNHLFRSCINEVVAINVNCKKITFDNANTFLQKVISSSHLHLNFAHLAKVYVVLDPFFQMCVCA